MKDYYRILEVHPEASPEVLTKAYRTLVHKYHPDLYHTTHKNLMIEKMKEINEAYDVLGTESARREYDRKYAEFKAQESRQTKSPLTGKSRLKRLLFWFVGTYLTVKFLLKPVLMNPSLRIIFFGLILIVGFRLYVASKRSKLG